jgi:hypothetical protein
MIEDTYAPEYRYIDIHNVNIGAVDLSKECQAATKILDAQIDDPYDHLGAVRNIIDQVGTDVDWSIVRGIIHDIHTRMQVDKENTGYRNADWEVAQHRIDEHDFTMEPEQPGPQHNFADLAKTAWNRILPGFYQAEPLPVRPFVKVYEHEGQPEQVAGPWPPLPKALCQPTPAFDDISPADAVQTLSEEDLVERSTIDDDEHSVDASAQLYEKIPDESDGLYRDQGLLSDGWVIVGGPEGTAKTFEADPDDEWVMV